MPLNICHIQTQAPLYITRSQPRRKVWRGPRSNLWLQGAGICKPSAPWMFLHVMHSCRVSRHRRGTSGGMSSGARLCSAALLACAAILLLGPQHGHGQGLLLGSQLGSTPSLGRLLDPGTLTTPAAVSNTAAGADSTTAAGADGSTDGERLLLTYLCRTGTCKVSCASHVQNCCSCNHLWHASSQPGLQVKYVPVICKVLRCAGTA